MSRWIEFQDVSRHGARTRVCEVVSISTNATLGRIKWFGRWRQYAFFPEPDTAFNPECLHDISGEIARLMQLRRAAPREAPGA